MANEHWVAWNELEWHIVNKVCFVVKNVTGCDGSTSNRPALDWIQAYTRNFRIEIVTHQNNLGVATLTSPRVIAYLSFHIPLNY